MISKELKAEIEFDAVELHILKTIIDEKIGNLVTLPPYVDATMYTSQIIAIRKKIDDIYADAYKKAKLNLSSVYGEFVR